MATAPEGPSTVNQRGYLGLGAAAVTLGFFGLMFTMLAPLGVLLSGAGLICGILGWLLSRPGRQAGFWWSCWGTLLSLVAFGTNVGILNYNYFENWWLGRG